MHVFPEKLDTLIAFKVLCLDEALSSIDKRVGAAIIDHFNRKNAQCDPSIDRLADLLGVSRSSVIRSINKLVRLRLLRKVVHGGHLSRNQYFPDWLHARARAAAWQARFGASHKSRMVSKMTSDSSHPRHQSSGENATQSSLINQSNETFASGNAAYSSPTPSNAISRKRLGKEEERASSSMIALLHVKQVPSRDAAYNAAERRWNLNLQERYCSDQDIYARIVDAIDPKLQQNVTQEEQRCRGSGLPHLLLELRRRGIL